MTAKLYCVLLIVILTILSVHGFLGSSVNTRWLSRCPAKSGTQDSAVLAVAKKSKPKKMLDKQMFTTDDIISKTDTDSGCTFTIYGEPQVLERHRTLKTGMTYNPSASKQQLFRSVAMKHLPPQPFNGSLEVNLMFYFARPKNHFGSGKKSTVLRADKTDIFQSNRKDLDNLVKFVLDSLNKVAYVDDCQISMISAAKLYADVNERERIEISIRKLKVADKLVTGNFKKK